MRNAFTDELTKLGDDDERVVMLSGDADQQRVAAARVQPQAGRGGRARVAAGAYRRKHVGLD